MNTRKVLVHRFWGIILGFYGPFLVLELKCEFFFLGKTIGSWGSDSLLGVVLSEPFLVRKNL